MIKEKLAEIISTVFYIGKVKYAPGTFGSLAAYPIFIVFVWLLIISEIFFHLLSHIGLPYVFDIERFSDTLYLSIVLMIPGIIIFFIGIYYSNIYANYLNQNDTKEIIIDEVAGQLITLALCIPISMYMIANINMAEYHKMLFFCLAPFILFRFFDIVKPWPICWVDQNVKGGLGIMLDDLLAAIFAGITQYLILLSLAKYFKP